MLDYYALSFSPINWDQRSVIKLFSKILKNWYQFLFLVSNPETFATHLIIDMQVPYLGY